MAAFYLILKSKDQAVKATNILQNSHGKARGSVAEKSLSREWESRTLLRKAICQHKSTWLTFPQPTHTHIRAEPLAEALLVHLTAVSSPPISDTHAGILTKWPEGATVAQVLGGKQAPINHTLMATVSTC